MLTKKAKYALNALVFLAKQPTSPVRAIEISKQNNIPSKFLEGILSELVRIGVLDSQRGQSGGYSFLKDPKDILVVDILRQFDGAVGLVPCATHQFFKPCVECVDVEACKIRWMFKELRDLSVEFLKNKSIQDLL